MMATTATSAPARFATIIHLKTGHVLAAVTVAGAEPGLDDLTAGRAVRVRQPGTDGYVDVPASILVASRIALRNEDVLDHPHAYVLGSSGQLEQANRTPRDRSEGRLAVVVWRVEADGVSESVFDPEPGPLGDDGALWRSTPPGATQELLAYVGGPLTIVAAKKA
jgi:hypothetical protein